MITNPFQKKAYDAVAAALPFAIDPAKVTVEPGVSSVSYTHLTLPTICSV